VNATTKTAQIRLTRSSPACWRITFDNPPLNLMGPEFVLEFREIMTAIEADEQVKVVVFDSAVGGFFLNHSDFLAKLEDLRRRPPISRRRSATRGASWTSSTRGGWATRASTAGFFDARGVKIPVAVSVFPDEIYAAPQSWAERAYPKLIHYNKLDKGGHFAAWEQPQLFVEEMRASFKSLRSS
jgi:pimeloyl-ACP methyl ester carboxylesterase